MSDQESERVLDAEFERLLDASSLGTPGAKALMARTPPELVERVMRRVRELDREGRLPVEDLVPPSPEMLAAVEVQLAADEKRVLEHPEEFE